jgi:polyisoprenoid-binding protein YceI
MSSNGLKILGVLILMGISAVAGVLGYIFTVGGDGTARSTISAPTLDLSTATPNAMATQVAELSTQVADAQATNAGLTSALAAAAEMAVTDMAPTEEATMAPTEEPTAAPTEEAAAATGPVRYVIDAAQSVAQFSIFEELRGAPVTVLGTTSEVAGEIAVDFGTPANTRVGVIVINAGTFVTDNEFRNRAIRGEILETSTYEFIEFRPAEVSGLPDTLTVGEAITFQVTGELQIRDVVQTVTFEVTATATSETQLEGTATTTITREQYGLTIPSVPGVANVADDMPLELRFVATRAEAAAETTTEEVAAAPAEIVRYAIDAEQSVAQFSIFEELRGAPVTVLGTTSEVAGEIAVDFGTPANSRVGVIVINAGTFATDNEFRNRAIRGEILETNTYEFIEFRPTEVSGLPDTLTVGEAITFQVTGELQIRDVVQTVTFEVTATATSETQLEGTATTTITREQYGLTIPSVPGVANVADEMPLELRFVATQVE